MSDFQKNNGIFYAPKGISRPVVNPGEFIFAVATLDHGHIYGMCNGLIEAGAVLKSVFDPDSRKVAEFRKVFPQAQVVHSLDELLNDPDIILIASAAIPSLRCRIGLQVLDAGKDYFTDKAPLTTLKDLSLARKKVTATGRKYMVYYSERLHSECGMMAGDLIASGEIGKVIQVTGMGPHRLSIDSRPPWFFNKVLYGGILCDLGCHQIEQFLFYSGCKNATVTYSHIDNFAHPGYRDFDDYGDAHLIGDNGAVNYFRVDWFTPDGLSTWGDGRTFILGTKGYIELRKYVDIATQATGDHIYLVNQQGERHIEATGTVGYPFFGQLILDCLNRTENAMTQEHAFRAAELSIKAQSQAK